MGKLLLRWVLETSNEDSVTDVPGEISEKLVFVLCHPETGMLEVGMLGSHLVVEM